MVRENTFCVRCQISLPNVRHKTMLDFLLVLPITRQMICKEPFFIKEPPYQERHHAHKYKEPPVRAERKRRANEIQRCTCIHGMAHQGIGPGRDYLLIFSDLDGRRCE